MRHLGPLLDGFEVLANDGYPETFTRNKKVLPGEAMSTCARHCDQPYILFLEEDWLLVTRPVELVTRRLRDAANALQQRIVDMVHLRHKVLFGPPFYEFLTSRQHNEPPSPFLAFTLSEDPTTSFPDAYWRPPFQEVSSCEGPSNRTEIMA